jgi:hypothetical protein
LGLVLTQGAIQLVLLGPPNAVRDVLRTVRAGADTTFVWDTSD